MIVGPMSEFPADTSMDLLECSIGDLLCDIAAAQPDRTCVSWVDSLGTLHSLTYRQVRQAARVRAAALLADARPADRVALWAQNSGAWIVSEYAVALAGMVLVPLNPALTDGEAHYILSSSGAVIGIADGEDRRDLVTRLRSLQEQLPALRVVHDLDAWQPTEAFGLPAVDRSATFLLQYT